MSSYDFSGEFDRDIAAAHEALEYGVTRSPSVVTPERKQELDQVLERLYLPNVDNETVTLTAAEHPLGRIAYIPYVCGKQLTRVIVSYRGQSRVNDFDLSDHSKRASLFLRGVEYRPRFAYLHQKLIAGIFNSTESPQDQTTQQNGGSLLHEGIHTRQAFRQASMDPVPPELSNKPVKYKPTRTHAVQQEAEAFWFEFDTWDDDSRERLNKNVQETEEKLEEYSPTNSENDLVLSKEGIMKFLLDRKLLSTDSAPMPEVETLLTLVGFLPETS